LGKHCTSVPKHTDRHKSELIIYSFKFRRNLQFKNKTKTKSGTEPNFKYKNKDRKTEEKGGKGPTK